MERPTSLVVRAMLRAAAALVAAVLASPSSSATADAVEGAEDVEGAARARLAVEAKTGDTKFRRARAVRVVGDQVLTLRVRKPKGASDIRWFLVFPDLTRRYNNANPPGSEGAYAWRGYDPISYHRVELTPLRGQFEIQPFAGEAKKDGIWKPVRVWLDERETPKWAQAFYHDDVGTFRFSAEVTVGDKVLRTPGLPDVGAMGISPRVFRVTRVPDKTYLGSVRGFFNVPGVFGSVNYQSQHYIGVDCADVLVTANRKWRKRPLKKNYNVDMLVGSLKRVGKLEIRDGKPDDGLSWGDKVKPGYLLAVKYEGATRFQHIGVLSRDADGDGVLSAKDTIVHAGPWPLQEDPLSGGAFDGTAVILRPSGVK